MLEHVESIFENMNRYLKRMKRPIYKKNMEEFRMVYGPYFSEMKEYVGNSADKKASAKEVAEVFTTAVYDSHMKNGKMKLRMQDDLNFFMVYYVFPAILLLEGEEADLIAEAVCAAWNEKNVEGDIGYMPYDKVCSTFQDKIFGIF